MSWWRQPRSKPLRSRAMGLYLEEACKFMGEAYFAKETRASSQGPAKSSQLYAPVPAHSEARSSSQSTVCHDSSRTVNSGPTDERPSASSSNATEFFGELLEQNISVLSQKFAD